jgi:transaldolase
MATRLHHLLMGGQSPWYDNFSRDLLISGALQALVDAGITGVTANPAIFERAIAASTAYDAAIGALAADGIAPWTIAERLVVEDIRATADVLRPTYERMAGHDGYVSVEVSPLLARDTTGTVEEALRLYEAIGRPNVLVKVPATREGIPAIRQLIGVGINVNITLLFAIDRYDEVMEAYLAGLEDRAADEQPLDTVASVASFFVGRVDGQVDARLDRLIAAEGDERRRREAADLLGRVGIANARLAYRRFRQVFAGERFAALRRRGARLQRPLWASTGVKNPAYRDVRYVEELIGPDSVTTLPPDTLDAFRDHGRVARTVDRDLHDAERTIARLAALGIDLREVTDRLETDGIAAFVAASERLDATIRRKQRGAFAA